jgi:WD40 repeat protein
VLDVAQMKLTFHTARITSVAWSPCGQYLASGSLDGSVIVWDPVRDKCGAARVTIKNAHRGGVTSLVWRDHETLCSGGFDACVKTWWLRSVCQDVASAEVKEWQSTLPRR